MTSGAVVSIDRNTRRLFLFRDTVVLAESGEIEVMDLIVEVLYDKFFMISSRGMLSLTGTAGTQLNSTGGQTEMKLSLIDVNLRLFNNV
jgi:hypothetical protein